MFSQGNVRGKERGFTGTDDQQSRPDCYQPTCGLLIPRSGLVQEALCRVPDYAESSVKHLRLAELMHWDGQADSA
jgi:hypothetical protein